MCILDNYILKRIIYGYLFIALTFICLYLFIDISLNLSDILKIRLPWHITAQYYLNMLPLIFLTVSPYSILISTLHSFGELNKNNEILGMRSTGVSILKICLPVIVFALFISISAFFIQEKVVLNSQKTVDEIKLRFIKKNVLPSSEEKNLAFSSEDLIFFANRFLPQQGILKNVTIFKENANGNIREKMICKEIIYSDSKWAAKDIIQYKFDDKGNMLSKPYHWVEKDIKLKEKPRELTLKKSMFSQFTSLGNLKKEMNQLRKIRSQSKLNELAIQYHRKIATPLSHLFLVIGILPFALEIKKRKVGFISLGVGLMFGFAYYCLSVISISLGKSEIILPMVSVWLAPLFFLTMGTIGLILIK